MDVVRSDLLTANPDELLGHLIASGIQAAIFPADDGLHVVTDGDLDPSPALATFVPSGTIDRSDPASPWYREPLPDYVGQHVQHLRDYRTSVRSGVTPTLAQTAHVVADLIDALRLINRRVTGDD